MTLAGICEQTIRCMASEALEQIICASAPKLLFWDAESRRLRAVSATSGTAKKLLAKPGCLGTYDFDTRLQDIIDDLKVVCHQGDHHG